MPPQVETAVAVREQHPFVHALDERQDALAEMLPGGPAAARRFKRVVIQAMVKTPALMQCSIPSLLTAVMEAATIGIEPTGTLGGAYLVPYKGKATLIIGYRGLIDLCRRSGEIETIEARVVRDGDEFEYAYGTEAHVRHVPDLETSDKPLTHVYGVAKLRGGGVQFEVMTRKQVDGIKARSASVKANVSSPWDSDYEEMARKTVVRRLVKYLPIAIEARDLIERDDEREFDHGAVVARVASERSSQTRDRITERINALRRGESTLNETPEYEGEAVEPDQIPADAAAPASKRDPWMARLHALGAERGYDHDALHQWAEQSFGVDSLRDLTPSQRADLMEAVESQLVIETPVPGGHAEGPANDADSQSAAVEPSRPEPGEGNAPPAVSNDPILDAVLAQTGGTLEPPRPATDAYRAMSPEDRAQARGYWAKAEQAGARETEEPAMVGLGLDT